MTLLHLWIVFAAVSFPCSILGAAERSIKDRYEREQQALIPLTLPLISHSQLLQRRRRELVSSGHSDATDPLVGASTQHRHRPNRRRTHRSLRSAINHTIAPLYQGYGTHYVDLWVGSPSPQRQTVIVDTGSSITAFPCSECSVECGEGYHIDSVFQHDESTSFLPSHCNLGSFETVCSLGSCQAVSKTNVPQQGLYDGFCKLSQSYQEGSSWTAFSAKDWVYIGGPHDQPCETKDSENKLIIEVNEPVVKSIASLDAIIQEEISIAEKKEIVSSSRPVDFRFQLDFGCQTKITGLFITQLAAGIMGVDNTPMSFWNQMYNAGLLPSKGFALCFSHADSVLRTGSHAGTMTVGGFDTRLHKTTIAYAQNVVKSGWFTVHVRALYLRHKATQQVIQLEIDMNAFNRGGIIVDSGTTDTFLSSTMRRPFRRAFKKLSGMEFEDKFTLASQAALDALPTLLVQLQAADLSQNDPNNVDHNTPSDVVIEIPPSHYLECTHSFSCQAILFMTENGGDGGVLGANAMTGLFVVFIFFYHVQYIYFLPVFLFLLV